MKMTLRGYTRPKKDSKRTQSSRRHEPPRLDRDPLHNGAGPDYASYAAAQAARMRQDPRSCMRRPPPGFNEGGPFPGGPHGVRFDDEQSLAERLAFMNLGPGYPHHAGPGGGFGQMPNGHFPESTGYPGPSLDSRNRCITLRSRDFTDREVAAKYVSHLIKHGSETWVFRFPDEEILGSTGDPGPSPEEPASGPQQRQRHGPGGPCMRDPRFGPFGHASKKDD